MAMIINRKAILYVVGTFQQEGADLDAIEGKIFKTSELLLSLEFSEIS